MNRAVIVSMPSDTADTIAQTVRSQGFVSVASISSGSEARRLIKGEIEPDIVIINAPLSDEFGNELAETAAEETSAGVILLCLGEIAGDIAEKTSDYGITVLPKPINRELLSRAVREVSENKTDGMKKETVEVLSKIDEMRLINRAKSTLMKYLGFTEPQAHKYIEKQAMNNRQTRHEAAEHVLRTYGIQN